MKRLKQAAIIFLASSILASSLTGCEGFGSSSKGVVSDTGNQPPGGFEDFGFEGFGAVTQGANSSLTGFIEFHVTSLNDNGPGTLRDALSEGSRYIVFDVGGTINLESDLHIPWSYITIDGASAPVPGITIIQPWGVGTAIIGNTATGPAHDIIIHHLRVEGPGGHDSTSDDIWGLDGQDEPVYNVVIDHVTANGSNDGVFDIWGDVHDVTISWNLIADTVTALHLSNINFSRSRISFHHNVFAGNNERQIRIRHDNQLIDFVNNVVYGWGWIEGGGSGLRIVHDTGEINPSLNVVANVFHDVAGLSGTPDDAIVVDSGPDRGNVYFDGNIVPSTEGDDALSTSGPLPIPEEARVQALPATLLGEEVVPYVGTHFPTNDEQVLLNQISTELAQ